MAVDDRGRAAPPRAGSGAAAPLWVRTAADTPRTVQEVVILHLAARLGIDYECWEHVPMAMTVGVWGAMVPTVVTGLGLEPPDSARPQRTTTS